jgi:hypothetical protein
MRSARASGSANDRIHEQDKAGSEENVNLRVRTLTIGLLAGALLLVFGMARVSAAAEARCVDPYTVKKRPFALEGAIVLEGLPKGRADLLPEPQDYEWNIAPNQAWVTGHGKAMYLVCRYKGLRKAVNLQIPRDATACRVEQTGEGIAASCTPPVIVARDRNAKDERQAANGTNQDQH